MSILVGRDTRLVVQGITGREGAFHAGASQAYGTNVVAGVTPGKGGQTALDGSVPVFDTVAEAVARTGANTSLIFVPAAGAPDAIMEAASAGIATIFCITEGIPRPGHDPRGGDGPGTRRAPHRPQLPGCHIARSSQGGHHPGVHSPGGPRGRREPLWNAHL